MYNSIFILIDNQKLISFHGERTVKTSKIHADLVTLSKLFLFNWIIILLEFDGTTHSDGYNTGVNLIVSPIHIEC